MSDKSPASEAELLRHHTPPRLKFIGILAVCAALVIVAIGITLRLLAGGETRAWTEEQAVPTVRLITLGPPKGGSLTFPGDIEPYINATINAQISGYVQKWYADIGTAVKAGQLLAQIDPKPYRAALDQAKGQLARDSATLANAEVDLKRYQALAAQSAISAQQLSTQQATVAATRGVVATDKAAVEAAQINLGYTRIVAPISGVVTSRAIDVGQLVTVGTATSTPLFAVTDQNRLRIYVRIPQSYSGMIRPGLTAHFTVPEYPGRVFVATLAASANAIASQSGTQLVQFQIDNSDHALKPGAYAEMRFTAAASAAGTVQVPVTALLFRDQGMMVAMVDKNSKVTMKPVRITTDYGTTVEVGSGLKPGDRVIDNPPDALREGDVVHIAAAAERG